MRTRNGRTPNSKPHVTKWSAFVLGAFVLLSVLTAFLRTLLTFSIRHFVMSSAAVIIHQRLA